MFYFTALLLNSFTKILLAMRAEVMHIHATPTPRMIYKRTHASKIVPSYIKFFNQNTYKKKKESTIEHASHKQEDILRQRLPPRRETSM